MGTITGYAELTLDGLPADDPFRANITKILGAAQRSTALTRQLLIFARKQSATPVSIDLKDAVNTMMSMLHRLIGENIELTWLPPDEPCPVTIDPSQLDQILINLCINARDAIADIGRITIRAERTRFDETAVKAYMDCAPGDYVHLTVTDDGRGIDKETAKHMFMSGYTADVITDSGALDQASNFIQKPFTLKHFAAKLREVLDGNDREFPEDP